MRGRLPAGEPGRGSAIDDRKDESVEIALRRIKLRDGPDEARVDPHDAQNGPRPKMRERVADRGGSRGAGPARARGTPDRQHVDVTRPAVVEITGGRMVLDRACGARRGTAREHQQPAEHAPISVFPASRA